MSSFLSDTNLDQVVLKVTQPDFLEQLNAERLRDGRPTKQLSTVREYGRMVLARCERFLSLQACWPNLELDQWLCHDFVKLSPASLRKERAAFALILAAAGVDPVAALPRFFSLTTRHKPGRTGRRKTTSLRLRHCKAEEFSALVAAISRSSSSSRSLCVKLLRATLILGLREVEWKTAALIRDSSRTQAHVKIRNAKNSNGRSHGDHRNLHLYNFPAEKIDWLEGVIQSLREMEQSTNGGFETVMRRLRRLILVCWRRAFPNSKRTITLYTMRHWFSATAKRAGYTREEVAALMGHATNRTANIHYSPKRHGLESAVVPLADRDEVARIRQKYVPFPNQLQMQDEPSDAVTSKKFGEDD